MHCREALDTETVDRLESEYGCNITSWTQGNGLNVKIVPKDGLPKLVCFGKYHRESYAIAMVPINRDPVMYEQIVYLDDVDDVHKVIEKVIKL